MITRIFSLVAIAFAMATSVAAQIPPSPIPMGTEILVRFTVDVDPESMETGMQTPVNAVVDQDVVVVDTVVIKAGSTVIVTAARFETRRFAPKEFSLTIQSVQTVNGQTLFLQPVRTVEAPPRPAKTAKLGFLGKVIRTIDREFHGTTSFVTAGTVIATMPSQFPTALPLAGVPLQRQQQ